MPVGRGGAPAGLTRDIRRPQTSPRHGFSIGLGNPAVSGNGRLLSLGGSFGRMLKDAFGAGVMNELPACD